MRKVLFKLKSKIFNNEGFSLLELLITLAIFGILMVTTTRIITINLIVARKVKARTYAREETAFMLNVLKKDIRNAETGVTVTSNSIILKVTDENRIPKYYRWLVSGTRIQREDYPSGVINYQTPSDIEFRELVFQSQTTCSTEENCLIKITVNAWTLGMPGDPGVACSDDKQCVKKEVVVSTRNFNFD
jgi:prepilin-type N-terminal cleavage/methylation domain-containing protein